MILSSTLLVYICWGFAAHIWMMILVFCALTRDEQAGVTRRVSPGGGVSYPRIQGRSVSLF